MRKLILILFNFLFISSIYGQSDFYKSIDLHFNVHCFNVNQYKEKHLYLVELFKKIRERDSTIKISVYVNVYGDRDSFNYYKSYLNKNHPFGKNMVTGRDFPIEYKGLKDTINKYQGNDPRQFINPDMGIRFTIKNKSGVVYDAFIYNYYDKFIVKVDVNNKCYIKLSNVNIDLIVDKIIQTINCD